MVWPDLRAWIIIPRDWGNISWMVFNFLALFRFLRMPGPNFQPAPIIKTTNRKNNPIAGFHNKTTAEAITAARIHLVVLSIANFALGGATGALTVEGSGLVLVSGMNL